MEPSFLADLNLAQINLDENQLQIFGPLSRALFEITTAGAGKMEYLENPCGLIQHNPEYNPLKHVETEGR